MPEWVDLNWLREQTGYKHIDTLKRRILIPYREELEQFSYYPTKSGERWRFSRAHMEEWLRNHVV